MLEDMEGALWTRSIIDALRVQVHELPPLKRIVVAIDPNASSDDDSNECGIICVSLGDDDHGYVLDDVSGVMALNDWAGEAIALLRARMDDRIIAERNNGGEMVENTIRMVDRTELMVEGGAGERRLFFTSVEGRPKPPRRR